ncbi:hypothetical protein NB231_06021 [Nitrococcus mobilis Nb-231]|uniref:Uncharacterized protein n=1 Tax=Nitrococcus mobilis Nb-231 TaxID=314278 RepID=A4BQS1_9GAMM|nr:hypothetical protein NB231_06021 [Nitrococcus mobilis Nb-231]
MDSEERRRKVRRTVIILSVVAFTVYIAFYLERIFY